MNRHAFYLKRAFRQMTAKPASFVIIVFSFTVCAFSLFVLINELLYSTTFFLHQGESRRTFTITSSVSDNSELIEALSESDVLPEISDFVGLSAYPKGGNSQYIQAVLCSANDSRITGEPDVTIGRTFSESELENGENVIIWCNNVIYINSGLREYKSVGDIVTIGNGVYSVIGISETDIYLPFSTALKTDDFDIRLNGIVFSEIPTKSEIVILEAIATVNDCTVKSRYQAELSDFLENGMECTVIIIGIILCVICIVSSLFDYMVRSMSYEYNIYKLLGISRAGLFELLYLPLFIMTVVSLVAGYALFCLSKPLQRLLNMYDQVDFASAVVVFSIMIIVMLSVTVPKYNRLFSGGVEM
ncbi:MAG: ABC transporter permease [Oscillospiraceae bacterium]|nr:ABC transporter permease [Oscillospiraceae bacterium]